jgi:predicted dehydrogenase
MFNYRGNPPVQQARTMMQTDMTGDLRFIHGAYQQDWMADPLPIKQSDCWYGKGPRIRSF